MPVSFSIDDRIKGHLDELLALNGVTEVTVDQRCSHADYKLADGRVALTVSGRLLKSAYLLSDDHDKRLHACLIVSGCSHFGARKSEEWPNDWLIADASAFIRGSKVAGMINGTIECSMRDSFAGTISTRTGCYRFGVALIQEEKRSFMSPELDENPMNSDWLNLVRRAASLGFTHRVRNRAEG